MLPIIGQKKLIDKIERLGNNFPHFIILEGEKGSGKNLIVEHISKMLNAPINRADDLKIDTIRKLVEDSNTLSHQTLFLIDNAESMGIPAQNALLKFTEEPNSKAYIIMTVRELNVLPTLISRACLLFMDLYSPVELAQFTDSEIILDVCTTPGQILDMQTTDLEGLMDLCYKVIDSIHQVNISNLFNIVTKNIDEDKPNRYSPDAFIRMLIYCTHQRILENYTNPVSASKYRAYLKLMLLHKNMLRANGINKKNVLDIMCVAMWKEGQVWSI